MRFDVITLFPELFAPHMANGVTRRAFAAVDGKEAAVDVRLWQLRDFADDAYHRVDDRPYGGGPGMVMMAQPLQRALLAVRDDRSSASTGVGLSGSADSPDKPTTPEIPEALSTSVAPPSERGIEPAPLVMFTPTGRPLTQSLVEDFAVGRGAILLCGRYEGVDQRFVDREVDMEISLGDFVLSGGELPALVLLDAVARLRPGVLNDARSHLQDSFSDGLLDCPHYSRPEVLDTPDGPCPIPPVLMSGHHADIARWRRDRSLEITASRRPDLIVAARAAGKLSKVDEKLLRALAKPSA
ncbi:MAG: tRNA ((37)-N1)-methyltransferase TrmD [Rhizobacter sp.]|nr:tRNA ((37)-N1)-methyltransferase TrmD [Rhizobacter sp.]